MILQPGKRALLVASLTDEVRLDHCWLRSRAPRVGDHSEERRPRRARAALYMYMYTPAIHIYTCAQEAGRI
eukprot:1488896-Pleurochrysis_carterae.AAC.1